MSKEAQRWTAGAFGFALAVIGTTQGVEAALFCLLGAACCAGIVVAREQGAVGRAATLANGARKKLEAHAQAARRPAEPARRPRPTSPRPKAAKITRPYNHDEQSGEHVYEVATYGW